MPVSLCEWRVQIGTFVHWIRDYEIKERKERLMKERIRRMKILCERLKVKMDDSEQDSEEDDAGESREDGLSPMKRKQCPHKTTNIQSSGDSYIKDLLTSCDQCIHDLLTTSHCCTMNQLTPADGCIRKLLKPCDNGLKDMTTQDYRSVKDLLRSEDYKVKDLITPADCSVKDVITSEDCSIKDLITPEDCSVRDLIKPEDCSVKDLITPEDCSVKYFITPEDCSIKDLITPEDCSVKDLITPEDCSVKDLITPEDCSVKVLITPEDNSLKDLMTLEDCRVKDLITPEYGNVKYLISPDNSQVKGVLGQSIPEFNFSSALSQIKPRSEELKKSNDKPVDVLRTATDENTELVTPFVGSYGESVTESCSRHHHTLSDTSFKEHLSTNKSLTRNKLNNDVNAGVSSYSREKQSPSQCSLKEQMTSPCSKTHKGLGPRLAQSDHLSVGLLESAVSAGEDLFQLSDFCIHEPCRSCDSFFKDNRKTREPYTSGKEQHPGPGTFTNERPIRTSDVIEDQVSSESSKQFQTSTDTPVEEKSSVMVPYSSRDHGNNKRHGKAKPNGACTSLCPGPSLNSKTGLIPEEMPPISELLLLRSGDVELNPGPRQGTGWSLDLERELLSLVKDVSPVYYYDLCNALDFTHAQSAAVLSKHHWDFPTSLFEIICSWGLRQRDGTNYKEVLADKLRNVNLDALGRKLLQGGYRMTEPPAPGGYRMTEPPASADLDKPQPVIDMTEEQLIKCGEDLKTFYLEEICKIKPDPLDFTSVLEFERIYTNLTLLNSKTPLDYTELLTTKVNGIPPKRLMVEGEGGVGKTTFCSKIAWDWANGSSQFNQFSWVLVIPLRNVIKGQKVGDIVKNYLSDSNSVTPVQIDNYIRSQPTKVLIVLDGLDEYDGDLYSEGGYDFSQILRRKKFKECTVLVTTRPWRADQIKCNRDLSRSYAFIAVKGFSPENVSSYIRKYFVSDQNAGSELIRFIEVNDVIKENMAPFPIYVAMLCILWENSDFEKREKIRRLKTFSQLFDQMVMFLKDHYASKNPELLRVGNLQEEMENINSCLLEIGSIAFQGLLTKKLTFTEEDFISCKKAMETCCRVGVLSRENQNISRWKRTSNTRSSVTTSVFFPHKLFQEYIAALHLDSLYDTGREEYNKSLDKVVSGNSQEFRYLLYFAASRGPEIGLDIVNKIQKNVVQNDYYPYPNEPLVWNLGVDYVVYEPMFSYLFFGRGDEGRRRKGHNHFLVDVTFEAYNEDTAKSVGRRIFAEEKILTMDEDMPAHTVSGYLFIMEQHGMETFIFRGRSCGPTVSRDLADVLCSSSSLSRLEFHRTTLDRDFYRLLEDQTSSAGVTSVKQLYVDHQFLGDLHKFDVTVGDLFPGLQQLGLTTLQTVTPGFVERLTHPNLSVLSIKADSPRRTRDLKKGEEWPVPLIGEPASLGKLFSSSFPQLTSLSFKGLVIGNKRCETIISSLRNHKNMKSTSFINCFTDDELDFLARQISKENRIAITLDHDLEQTKLTCALTADLMDALCHRTCIRTLYIDNQNQDFMVRSRKKFSEVQGIEVDSKIQTFTVKSLELLNDQSASCCLVRFICLLPCLTDLTIKQCSFHDVFYKEIAERASSFKIQTFKFKSMQLRDDQSASCCLVRFICLLPCLTDLMIRSCSFHDVFYKEIAERASSSKIQTFTVKCLELRDDQSASCGLVRFICLLPCLTDLTIHRCFFHDVFYKEIAERASSSKIQTFTVMYLELRDDQSASCYLVRFICLLPRLTYLMIEECSFHDELCKEIAERASSSKIQTFKVAYQELYDDQSASCCLEKFICLLPCLTDLRIDSCFFHDEFYKEIANRTSSSKIKTLFMSNSFAFRHVTMGQSASKQLAKIICSLPCLTDLTLELAFHDDFYTEITSLAASSQIQTLVMSLSTWYGQVMSQSAWKQLAKFLCSLPCLTDLTLKGYDLHDHFYTKLTSLAASSQNPYFRNNKHMGMLREWSARKEHRQQQLKKRRQALNQAYQHNPRSREQLWPNILQPRRLAQPYIQYQDYHLKRIQSENEELQPFPREGRHHSLNLGLRETSQHSVAHTSGPLGVSTARSSRNIIDSFTSRGRHSVGITQMHRYGHDPDRPSTSGLSSAHSRIGAASVPRKDTSIHVGKRSHSDSDSDDDTGSTSESKQRHPRGQRRTKSEQRHSRGKRRTKTDRNPDSP